MRWACRTGTGQSHHPDGIGVPRRVALGKLVLVFRRAAPRNLLARGHAGRISDSGIALPPWQPGHAEAHFETEKDPTPGQKIWRRSRPSCPPGCVPVCSTDHSNIRWIPFSNFRPVSAPKCFSAPRSRRAFDAVIVEKDFWVCWTLKELFRLPTSASISSSKAARRSQRCSKVIERFSEDIDVSIDRSWLGFGGANEPEAGEATRRSNVVLRRSRSPASRRSVPCFNPP